MGEAIDLGIYRRTGHKMPPVLGAVEVVELDGDNLSALALQIDPDSAAESDAVTTASLESFFAKVQGLPTSEAPTLDI